VEQYGEGADSGLAIMLAGPLAAEGGDR
jgi:hypothetical protein